MEKKFITCAVYKSTEEWVYGEYYLPASNHKELRMLMSISKIEISEEPIGFWDFETSFLDTVFSKNEVNNEKNTYWENTWGE